MSSPQEFPFLEPSGPEMVSVVVENFVGQRSTVRIRKAATVRQLKEQIENLMRVQVDNQTLIRKRADGGEETSFTQLDDSKTLDHYNLTDGERVMLVPSMKAAPPGYGLKNPSTARVFVDAEGSSEISSLIDRALAEKNQTRDPNAVYFLAQLPGQPPGTITVVQYRAKLTAGSVPVPAAPIAAKKTGTRPKSIPTNARPFETDPRSSIQQNLSSGSSEDSELEKEQQQNDKTRSVMSKLRAKIRKMKQGKKKNQAGLPCTECKKNPCKCGKSSNSKSSGSDKSTRDRPFSDRTRNGCKIS